MQYIPLISDWYTNLTCTADPKCLYILKNYSLGKTKSYADSTKKSDKNSVNDQNSIPHSNTNTYAHMER